MSSATAPAQLQGTALPMNQKLFAFATMCLGMFIALLDIQIVSASLRDIGGEAFLLAMMKRSGCKPAI